MEVWRNAFMFSWIHEFKISYLYMHIDIYRYIYIYMHLARRLKVDLSFGNVSLSFEGPQDRRETSPRTNLRNLCLESCKFLCKPSILGVCLVNKDPKVKCRELSKVAFQMGKGPWMSNGARAHRIRQKSKKKKTWKKVEIFSKGSRVYLNKTTLETHL